MAIDLKDWANGDTDYIATYNSNNAVVEGAVGALQTGKQDLSAKAQANGYASLGSDGKVPSSQLDLTLYQPLSAKGQVNGYASLDATGRIPVAQIPDVTVSAMFGGVEVTSAKDQANGYAGLDSGGKLKVAELPSTVEVTGHKGAASGYCDLDGSAHVPASRLVAANMPDLSSTYETTTHASATYDTPSARDSAISTALAGYTPGTGGAELTANKNQPSGYCGLDSGGHVAAAQLTAANIPDLSGTYETGSHAASTYAAKTDLLALVPCYRPGMPDASEVMLAFLPTVACTIPANLAGTRCKAGTNPTATATLSVQKNGSEVATIQIATSGATTLSTQAAISLSTSDELTVVAPSSQDATLAGVRLTIHATR